MMLTSILPCAFLFAVLKVTVSGQQDPDHMVTYDENFITGLQKYSLDKWADAILYISQAMEQYKQLETARLKCFKKCDEQEAYSLPSNFPKDATLKFSHAVISRGACIKECEEEEVGLLPWGGIHNRIFKYLRNRDGYNYLQLALYREGRMKEAARASATFNYFRPHNMHIERNLIFYKTLKDITEDDLKSMETFKYRELFSEAHQLFYTQDWEKMVEVLKESLQHFFTSFDECRTLCDGPLRHTTVLDLAQLVSKLYLDRQACRVKCVDKLGEFRGDRREDFFGAYFHYLQQGYFHLNDSLQALQASASQVQLEPTSQAAKRNSVFYLRQPGVTKKDFKPREDVLPEIRKRVNDLDLLKLYSDLVGRNAEEHSWHLDSDEAEVDEDLLEEDFQKYPVGQPLLMENIEPVVVQTSVDSGGAERLVLDDLLTQDQCQQLIHLASYGREGDGYPSKSPHTQKEKFEGLHILDAAKRSKSGEFDETLSWLYVNSSKIAKDFVAKEFDLSSPLYFSYTHLVCRTALEGMQDGRQDLSHPVHSDNCILNEATGECDKVAPAYTWRDYSAILYLNGDFEGGDFFFAHSLKDLSPDVRVKPKCGRLVGFSAGKENLHGVTAVTKGKRCAVALWFTLDPKYKEGTFDEAAALLTQQ